MRFSGLRMLTRLPVWAIRHMLDHDERRPRGADRARMCVAVPHCVLRGDCEDAGKQYLI